MNNPSADHRLPLGLFPGQRTAELYDRVTEVLRTRRWRFLVMPTGKGFVQVSLMQRIFSSAGVADNALERTLKVVRAR
jgi:hypothetical protein